MLIQYTYEFIRGSRIITEEQLDACEVEISDWFVDVDLANTLLNNTGTTDDTEGVFQILDSFAYFTPIVYNCYNMGIYMADNAASAYRSDQFSFQSIGTNSAREAFYIISDILGEIANVEFGAWYSFMYYFGDLVYRIVLSNNMNLDEDTI